MKKLSLAKETVTRLTLKSGLRTGLDNLMNSGGTCANTRMNGGDHNGCVLNPPGWPTGPSIAAPPTDPVDPSTLHH